MRRIDKLASIVVWRGFGFCWLAIATAMSGLVFDLALAFRVGALLAVILAVVLQYRADTYHRIRRIDESEVWILLPEADRPPREQARSVIVAAMRSQLREKALYAAVIASVFLAAALLLRLAAAWGGS